MTHLTRRDFLKIASVGAFSTFLPTIILSGKLFSANLGTQVEESDVSSVTDYLHPGRVIEWAVKWSQVEATRGVYSWPANYDANYAALAGYETIIGIKCVPEWARLWLDIGSPPKPQYYPELIRFIQAVQDRYHPTAIELFNEPDTKRTPGLPYGEYFGSWVQDSESWYDGGRRYGYACAAVYPTLGSKLLAGALMMHDGSLDFLRGALDAGMRCDAISYHTYVNNPEQFNRPMEHAEQIAGLVANDTPLVLSETGVTGAADTDELRQWQVDYLTSLTGWNGVILKNWYCLNFNPWGNCSLLGATVPKPVYQVWTGV